MDVAIEAGPRWTFATVLEWPGLCRRGRDEKEAIQNLGSYSPRYAAVLSAARIKGFESGRPRFNVVERVEGDSSTDFGVPSAALLSDSEPLTQLEMKFQISIARACWAAFDAAARKHEGAKLTKGPRGGGRSLAQMVAHVTEAEGAYVAKLGVPSKSIPKTSEALRDRFIYALGERVRGEIEDKGPRGGTRSLPRFAVRRSAWHSLDHAWEIEDRAT